MPEEKTDIQPRSSKSGGVRRRGREFALQLLYQLDYEPGQADLAGILDAFWEENKTPPAVKTFAEELVRGTLANLPHIDQTISQMAINWRIERMAVIDRSILRFAAYEILYRDDIPPKVSINEALEIAKKYSTPGSIGFINGILDKIAHQNNL